MPGGPEKLARIAAGLQAAGDRGLTLRSRRVIRAVAAPIKPALKAAALRQLPHAGELDVHVAGQKVSMRMRLSARNTDIRFTTTAPDTAQTNAGYVRHPTFGRRGKGEWRTEGLPQAKGWWTDTCDREAAALGPALNVVLNEVAAEISRA